MSSVRRTVQTPSIHGCSLIAGANSSRISRLVWLLALATSTALFLLNAHQVYTKWRHHPDIAIRINQKHLSEIPMPAVTICPPLFVKHGLVNFTDFFHNFHANNVTDTNMTTVQANHLFAHMHACKAEAVRHILDLKPPRDNDNIVRLMSESSPDIADVFKVCEYFTTRTHCNMTLNRVLTRRGFCFAHNMLGFNGIFNEREISGDFDSYTRRNIAKYPSVFFRPHHEMINDTADGTPWSLAGGFSADHKTHAVPVTAKAGPAMLIGAFTSASITSTVCKHESLFKYHFHLPNEMMTSTHRGYRVRAGEYDAVSLNARMYRIDEGLRGYDPAVRGCYEDGERDLRFFKAYTLANCNAECTANRTLKWCGCVSFWMPREEATKVCMGRNAACTARAVGWDRKTPFDPAAPCGCLRPCSDIRYSVNYKESGVFTGNK
jgi:amiloride-sensitive sodium channel